MNIRCENSLDYQTIAEVNIQAFEQKNEAHLVEQIRHSDRYIPELSLVAELNGVVVGHILFSYINLVGEESFQVLGLAPLAVRPHLQRQGVGSALVLAGLARAKFLGSTATFPCRSKHCEDALSSWNSGLTVVLTACTSFLTIPPSTHYDFSRVFKLCWQIPQPCRQDP